MTFLYIVGLSARFNAAKQTNNAFNLLWLYTDMSEDNIVNKSIHLAKLYSTDIYEKKVAIRSAAAEEYPQLKNLDLKY